MPHPVIKAIRIPNAARLCGYHSNYGRKLAKRGVFGRLIQIPGTKGHWVEIAQLENLNCDLTSEQIEDASQELPAKRTWPKKFYAGAVVRIVEQVVVERDADWLAWFNARGYKTSAGPARLPAHRYLPKE
jgi:hypothetical protein